MSGSGLSVLLQTEIDPNIVRPGWTPLLVTALLLVALSFLFLSLRKQLGKIHVPDDDRREAEARAAEAREAGPRDAGSRANEKPGRADPAGPGSASEASAAPPESR